MDKEQAKAEAEWKRAAISGFYGGNASVEDIYERGFSNGVRYAEPKWNVVETDGLPEEDGDYLTTYLGYNPLSDDVDGPPCTCEFSWFDDEWTYDDGFPARVKVIAWRPLPEPYQPAEGEGDSK